MTMSCHNTLHYTPMTFRSRVDLLDHVRESLDSYLPDPSVIGADEEPRKAAEDLVAFCERELTKIGETLDRVDAQHLDEYRECVVNALVDRIVRSREVAS